MFFRIPDRRLVRVGLLRVRWLDAGHPLEHLGEWPTLLQQRLARIKVILHTLDLVRVGHQRLKRRLSFLLCHNYRV